MRSGRNPYRFAAICVRRCTSWRIYVILCLISSSNMNSAIRKKPLSLCSNLCFHVYQLTDLCKPLFDELFKKWIMRSESKPYRFAAICLRKCTNWQIYEIICLIDSSNMNARFKRNPYRFAAIRAWMCNSLQICVIVCVVVLSNMNARSSTNPYRFAASYRFAEPFA